MGGMRDPHHVRRKVLVAAWTLTLILLGLWTSGLGHVVSTFSNESAFRCSIPPMGGCSYIAHPVVASTAGLSLVSKILIALGLLAVWMVSIQLMSRRAITEDPLTR
jgi:hypothetical protein